MENELNSLAVLKRRRLDGTESEAVFEKRRCIDSSHHSDWSDDDDPDWNDPDYDDGWIESELDRQHWEAEELAREAHDVEVMIDWEQDLRQLGLLAKAGQSRSLTEHIVETTAPKRYLEYSQVLSGPYKGSAGPVGRPARAKVLAVFTVPPIQRIDKSST